jgi:hypothetical protein
LVARDRPYSWRRRVRRNLSRLAPGNPLALGIAEGMARQAARHLVLVTPSCEGVAPLGAPSRRLCGAGPRFLTRRFALPPGSFDAGPFWAASSENLGQALRPAVSELLAGDRSVPGRSPGAARECEERTLAPAGAASDPTCMTPHDSALGGPNARIINAPERARISFRSSFVLVCRRCHRERDAACRCRPTFAMVGARGRSSMVERQLPKLHTRVRFPSPAQ